ncbi:hypothetical protein HWV62_27474 [Athelia sp. TMB]|nr:hypothetical protein HWV62_27474 [Athelia sp. TMB]
MQFSALVVLACALVASAAPMPANGVTAFAPVDVSNIANGNVIAVGNGILSRDIVDAKVPVHVSNVANGNKIAAANNIGHGKRGNAASVYAPITIQNVLNCNTVAVANNILDGLAHEFGCTVAQLGVTAEDIINCNKDNVKAFFAKLGENISKINKRDDILDLTAPIHASNIANGNKVGILNNVLRRDVAAVAAPVDASHIADYNVVDALNDIANGKRDNGVSANVPITVKDILNCNTIEIANNLLNHLAAEVGCTVAQLGVTAHELVDVTAATAHDLLAKIAHNVAALHKGKRGDLIGVAVPVEVSNVANGNKVGILNNVLKRAKGSAANVKAPVHVSNGANGNKVAVANN